MSFQPLTIFDQGFLGVGGELSQGHVTVNHEPNISCYMRHKTRKVRPGREPARQNKALGTKVFHMVFNRLQSVNITETGNVGVRLRRRAPIHLKISNVTVYYQFRRVLSLFVAEVWAMKKQFFRLKNILPKVIEGELLFCDVDKLGQSTSYVRRETSLYHTQSVRYSESSCSCAYDPS